MPHSVVTIPLSVTVWAQFAMQILTGVPTPKSLVPAGELGPPSNTMLLGTTRVSLPNGISFCITALAGCTSVIDRHTEGHTDRPCYSNIYCNTWRHLKTTRGNCQVHDSTLTNKARTSRMYTGFQLERDKCGSWTEAWKRNLSEFHQRPSATEQCSRVMEDWPTGDHPTASKHSLLHSLPCCHVSCHYQPPSNDATSLYLPQSQMAHGAALICSLALSQTPAYTARPQILGQCITWCARLLPSFCWYSLHTPTKGWPRWVDLAGWLHTEMVYLSADSHPSKC